MDDQRTRLMQSILGGSPGGTPSADDLLAQLSATDPTAAMILQYLAHQRAAAPDLADEDDEDETAVVEVAPRYIDEARVARWNEALRTLKLRVKALYTELEGLRARNDDLAAALGACAECWGDDSKCFVCEGCGRPGGAPPDPYLYARLIAPAARRLSFWNPAEDGFPAGAGLRVNNRESQPKRGD